MTDADEQPPTAEPAEPPAPAVVPPVEDDAPPVDELPPGLLVRPTEGTFQNVQRVMRVIT